MPIEILMPALSPTMEEGTLSKWLVKEGDTVASGDVIAEIETDKATMEVEAVEEGTVAKILVAAGTQAVKVKAPIAILAAEGEDVAEAARSAGSGGAKAAPAPEPQKTEAASDTKQEAPKAAAPEPKGEGGARVFASPLARRLAKEAGVDLAGVRGSGPKGRVVKADLEAAAASATARRPEEAAGQAQAPAAKSASDDAVLKLFEEGSFETVPHDGMRRTIAARLSESHQSVPSYFLSMDCRLDALLKLRGEINASAPAVKSEKGETPAYKLSVNDFVIKAMALALRDVPMANASWTSSARLVHKHADIGVAVAIPDGLITPIVRKAEQKTLSAISNEMKQLARRARERKLKPQEYQGGSTAVSNLGMFGVANFTSIINPPHASIVSIGAGEKKPVVEGDEMRIATVMTATFAFDHRVIDGALGAEFAAAFKRHIENPLGMLV